METNEYEIDTVIVDPMNHEHTMISHFEMLTQARDEFDETVTVIGLAS
jgi:hypothetical protein